MRLGGDKISTILSTLLSHIDAGRVVVAPSEVVAGDWRRRLLLSGDRRALLEDRLISWDRFKEETFGLRTDRRPVNRAFRRLFALDLIRRHCETPLFERLVHPEITDGAAGTADALLRFLPALPRLPEPPSGAPEREPDPAIRDLLRLRREYQSFLDSHGLFEPSWLPPSKGTLRESTALYFPELLEDFPRFQPFLEGTEGLHILRFGDLSMPETPRYQRFPTALGELRDVARRLSALLDAGVHPGDLAVTLPGWNDAFPYLERECRLLDVPLVPRRGRPLSEFPGARLFGLLQQAADGDLELTRVEALLMDPSIPWREDLPVSKIVAIGREGRSLGRFGPEGSPLDFWSDAFRRRRAPRELVESARRLFRIVTEVRRAPDLGALRGAIFRLLNGYIDRDAWPVGAAPALERALELLGGLAEAQAQTGIEVTDAFGVWGSTLRGTTYVPQSDVVGVPVYDYRVSAGLLPEYHFVPNAHHASTRVTVDPLPGLRGDQKARLLLEPVSFSDDFLRCYALSGRMVRISGAEEGITERQMSPDWFSPDQVTAPDPAEPDDLDAALFSRDPGLPPPPWIRPLRWEGMVRYGETEGAPAPGGNLPEELLLSALGDRLFSAEGTLLLSASRLVSYLACPQRYLLSYLLGLEEPDPRSIPEAMTPLDEGNLIHETLREIHQELRDTGARFGSLSAVSEGDLRARLSRVIRGWGRRNLPAPSLLAETLEYRLGPQLLRALGWEAREFSGGTPALVEASLSASPADSRVPGVLVRGKIDLGVALAGSEGPAPEEPAPGGLAIIDFKRGTKPGSNALKWTTLPPEEIVALVNDGWDGGKMDVQLPVYLLLVRAAGGRVLRGEFFSLRAGDDGKVLFNEEEEPGGDQVIGALEVLMEEVQRRLRSGALAIPNQGRGCGSCAFRGVCRAKFVSEEHYDSSRS
ncbi:MAG: PD-(D/E)XK nuclease family protein [Spirochaetaceae bacterium]